MTAFATCLHTCAGTPVIDDQDLSFFDLFPDATGDQYLHGLFPEQLEFIRDPSKFKALLTPARCGKSYTITRYLAYMASTAAPQAIAAYVTDTRKHAKQIIFNYFYQMFPPKDINMSDLKVKVGNSSIELFSADDEKKIERMRGIPYSIVVVDEAQSLKQDLLEKLVKEIVGPRMDDYDAPLIIGGTPGEIPQGFFHKITTEPASEGYTVHSWDQYSNIKFPKWEHLALKEERDDFIFNFLKEKSKKFGADGMNDPRYIREYCGRWTLDPGKLIYHLGARNHRDYPDHHKMMKFLAVDLGHSDATAFSIVGHDTNSGKVQLVFEKKKTGQGVEYVIDTVKELIAQFDPVRVVVDAGGIGAMVLESLATEIRKRWGLPVVAAQKSDKAVIMRMLDNDCIVGAFLLPDYSETWRQMAKLCWDEKRQREAERQECDLADACLYAYRDCTHYYKTEGGEDQEKEEELDPLDRFWMNPVAGEDDYLI